MTFIHDCFLFQITQYKIYFPPAKIGTIIEISKSFGNKFDIIHRKAPLPISSATRLDVVLTTRGTSPREFRVTCCGRLTGLQVWLSP
jgi:hypothetical protein